MAQDRALLNEVTVPIKKSEKAPFPGYLLPEPVFVQVNADLDAGKALELELQKCRNEKFECISGDTTRQSLWFGAGAALATIIFVAISAK